MTQIKRETAMICMIEDLLKADFVKTEGWNPSYFATDLGDVSRVNVVGVVVSNETSGGILLDDSTGRILLRSFQDNPFSNLGIGDLVMVIGRPRIYSEQKYVLPEIIKKINPAWANYRQVQIKLLRKKTPATKRESRVPMQSDDTPANHFQRITSFIKDLDDGTGADMNEVIKRSIIPEAEKLIRKLIEEGEVFEIRAGKLKILE